jgi:uncharacterized protein YijF (DUF1287 family)
MELNEDRREILRGLAAVAFAVGYAPSLTAASTTAANTKRQRYADAAGAQVGVTLGYDPTWTHIAYPGGDVPRSTGVCADVVIRAGRDGLGLDLQQLVHEDMVKDFDAYPARKVWGSRKPDANIDHRRVLILQTYFSRVGARLWEPKGAVAGDAFPLPLQVGDTVTWMLDARLPHIGIVVDASPVAQVVHNIGRGAEQTPIAAFSLHRAAGHYRWPV